MKALFVLFCSILLAPMVALSESRPDTIMILIDPLPASARKQLTDIADYLQGVVENQLKISYPCAQPIKDSDIKKMLEFEKGKEVLDDGGKTDFESIAKALEVKYLINIKVLEAGPGKFNLNAFMVDRVKTNTLARESKIISDGDDARDAAKAFAKQFVDSLSSIPQLSKSTCKPTNPWTGTITYRYVKKEETNEKPTAFCAVGRESGPKTETVKDSVHHEVTIRIGLTGKPQAFIAAAEQYERTETGECKTKCGLGTIGPEFVWKSSNYIIVKGHTAHAIKKVEAAVSIGIDKGRYTIGLIVPELVGKMRIVETSHMDGGCVEPVDKRRDFEGPWTFHLYYPHIDLPLQKPDELIGSQKVEVYGGILTWNLTRTSMKE
jgi:hypothetical protein